MTVRNINVTVNRNRNIDVDVSGGNNRDINVNLFNEQNDINVDLNVDTSNSVQIDVEQQQNNVGVDVEVDRGGSGGGGDLPPGGLPGQILTKTDSSCTWRDPDSAKSVNDIVYTTDRNIILPAVKSLTYNEENEELVVEEY